MTDRFILFAGADYYPAGGAEDIVGFFPTVSAAVAGLRHPDDSEEYPAVPDWFHILDLVTRERIKYLATRTQVGRRTVYEYPNRATWAAEHDARLGLVPVAV